MRPGSLVCLAFGVVLGLAAALPALAASPALVIAPRPGLGVQAETGLWGLRLEAAALTDAGGLTGWSVELDRPLALNIKWLPVSELDLGARLSSTENLQLLAALRRRFDLQPDLHFDLKVGVCVPGVTYLGAAVVQDWF